MVFIVSYSFLIISASILHFYFLFKCFNTSVPFFQLKIVITPNVFFSSSMKSFLCTFAMRSKKANGELIRRGFSSAVRMLPQSKMREVIYEQ